MDRIHRDPDRCTGLDLLVGDRERTFQRSQDLACCGDDVVGMPGIDADDGKLVTPEPGDGVSGSQDTLEPRRHLLQEVVTAVVAESVIDVLEAIQIEQQDAEHRLVAARGQQRLAQAVTEQRPIGEAGQRVV